MMENTGKEAPQDKQFRAAADGIAAVRHRGFGTIRSTEVICTKTSGRERRMNEQRSVLTNGNGE